MPRHRRPDTCRHCQCPLIAWYPLTRWDDSRPHAGRGLCYLCYQRFQKLRRLHEYPPLTRRPLRPPSDDLPIVEPAPRRPRRPRRLPNGGAPVTTPATRRDLPAARLCEWRPDTARCRTLNCYRFCTDIPDPE